MKKQEINIRAAILRAEYCCTEIALMYGVHNSTVRFIFESMIKSGDLKKDHFVNDRRGKYFETEHEMMFGPVYKVEDLSGPELEMLEGGNPFKGIAFG